jgi:serine/threonine-protein kinase RsbW
VAAERVRIEIIDEGEGFDPAIVPDCTLEDRLDVPSGRGVMLIRSFMTRVEYNEKGNAVVLEKARLPDEA